MCHAQRPLCRTTSTWVELTGVTSSGATVFYKYIFFFLFDVAIMVIFYIKKKTLTRN